jgi:hypothetical protein
VGLKNTPPNICSNSASGTADSPRNFSLRLNRWKSDLMWARWSAKALLGIPQRAQDVAFAISIPDPSLSQLNAVVFVFLTTPSIVVLVENDSPLRIKDWRSDVGRS